MFDYHALAPELILGITLLAAIAVDLVVPERLKYLVGVTALLGLVAAALPLITLAACSGIAGCAATGPRVLFGGSYVVDDFALVLKGLFIISGVISLLLSVGYLESDDYYQGEFYFLLLASVTGAVIMASARDLMTIFVGLELVSAPAFLLAGWRKGDRRSNEASLKFFLTGVLSAAVMLFGMSLVYGLTGNITFAGIAQAITAFGLQSEPALVLAVVFVIVGFAFKISAVPFHFWAPDTYEGAPTPVAAYLSVGSKAAGFVGLLTICYQAFAPVRSIWGPILWVVAALSMTVGNLIALRQTNVVRLLGYSSIAHGGFILVPFAMAALYDQAGLADAFFGSITYVLFYAFLNLGAFAAVIAVVHKVGSTEITDWGGLNRYAPGLAALVTVFFFGLAGVPPLAGWFPKFVMFRAVLGVFESPWAIALAVIAAVNAVIALVYYAGVVKRVYMDNVPVNAPVDRVAGRRLAPSLVLALAITAAATVIFGFFPQLLAFFGDVTRAFVAAP